MIRFIYLAVVTGVLTCTTYKPGLTQTPLSFRYQAVVQNATGDVIGNKKVSFLVTILKGAIDRERVYSEFHSLNTDQFGMVSMAIGKGNPLFGSLVNIDWGQGEYFLKVEMDEEGGTHFKTLGETQLLSVPYALHARTAENTDDADADPANELQTLSINGRELSISGGNKVILPIAAPDPALPVPIAFRGRNIYVYPVDNGADVVFGTFEATGATSDFDGKANTQQLIHAYGSGSYAARACEDLEAFGYDDWYLPSRAELDAIFKQSYLIQDYAQDFYWSSTETAANKAYALNLLTGELRELTKNQSLQCRCVRSDQ